MTLTGSYKECKEYVLAKMKKRCKALAEDDVIPHGEIKELAVTSDHQRHRINISGQCRGGAMDWSGIRRYIKNVDSGVQTGVGVLDQHG